MRCEWETTGRGESLPVVGSRDDFWVGFHDNDVDGSV